MIKPIIEIGNPMLREKSEKLSEIRSKQTKDLIQDLSDTLQNEEIGVAISAVQIGILKRLFIIHFRPRPNRPDLEETKPLVFINPEIVEEYGDKKKMFEGCLSIPNLFGKVQRKSKLKLKYINVLGEEKEDLYEGFMARVIQHEYDHLEGILFTDLADPKTIMSDNEYRKMRNDNK